MTLEYPLDTRTVEQSRNVETGGWGGPRELLTFKCTFPSFRSMLESHQDQKFDVSLRVFLILSQTYLEDDFPNSIFPQLTFKGIGATQTDRRTNDMNLIDIAEIGADAVYVGGILRLGKKLIERNVRGIIHSRTVDIKYDGKSIGHLTDSLLAPHVPLSKRGIKRSVKLDNRKSAVVESHLQLSLTRQQITAILENSTGMHPSDLEQYGEPRIVFRINYPERDLENIGPHPLGVFIVQGGRKETLKVPTERVSYEKL